MFLSCTKRGNMGHAICCYLVQREHGTCYMLLSSLYQQLIFKQVQSMAEGLESRGFKINVGKTESIACSNLEELLTITNNNGNILKQVETTSEIELLKDMLQCH